MPAARDAAAVELGAVVEDLEAGARRDAGPHRPVGARRHIVDAAAGDAREVIVRRRVAVEARAGGVRALRHESLGGERPEVAVDRRETHARQPPAHAPVDERRGRMRVGRADDLEDDPALPREPEAPGAQRSVGREGNDVFSNHYQQADAVYPARQELSTAGCSGASCPLPVDYPPQEDRSNGPALWAPDPRSPAEQPQERLARDPARPAHGRDRRVRLRQVVARLRHALRRRAVALHRVAVHLRGFARVRVNGVIHDLATPPPANLTEHRTISVVLDRVVLESAHRTRIAESVEAALREGGGQVAVEVLDGPTRVFAEDFRCSGCGAALERPQPLLFSFNHPLGACPECKGFGNILRYDEARVVPDRIKSPAEGAVEPWT